jgi:hypothetical protein
MTSIFNMSGTFFNTNTHTNTNLRNSTEQMIAQDIKMQCACAHKPQYKKLVTSGNDPSISKKIRYSAYVRQYGTTQSYNTGGKTFTNIGIVPPSTEKQIEYEAAVLGIPYVPPIDREI